MNQQRMPFRLIAVPVFISIFALLVGVLILNENKVTGWILIAAAIVSLPLQVVVRGYGWKKGYLSVRR